jgi:hypothetical protein
MPGLRVYTLKRASTCGSAGSTLFNVFQAERIIQTYETASRMERCDKLSNRQATERYQRGGRAVITRDPGSGRSRAVTAGGRCGTEEKPLSVQFR